MSSNVVISIEGVSKCFEMYAQPRDRLLQFLARDRKKYYQEFWALKDVSFSVQKGETVGILGRNGSGKSTLLQIIAGTLGATSGVVRTNGVLAALLELGSGFNPEFSGRENIFLNGAILGLSREDMEAKFDKIASFADIGAHLDQPVKTYSSGMAVRLAFAVQACIEPQVLIVDEALSVGDEKFQRKCFDYIERLRGGGCSILLVTHSTSTVEKFCQRGVLLHQGRVHGIGPAKEIVDQYHALLYSDEKAYVRYLNQAKEACDPDAIIENNDDNVANENKQDESNLRALIRGWEVLGCDGERRDIFRVGDRARVRFHVDVFDFIEEIQGGVLIRTIEGVGVFGTSTLYHNKNCKNVRGGESLTFEFDIDLRLCSGAYFITLAIAESISHDDMAYLDRKTDIAVLKISQTKTMCSGIAALECSISVSRAE